MLEVVLAVLFFTMMTLLVAATLPIASRSARQGADTVQATSLLMHKIDQLQSAGFDQLTGPTLSRMAIVDDAGTLPATNAGGDGTGSARFTAVDRLTTYFANYASHPEGSIELAPYVPSQETGSSPARYTVIQATVTMTWRDVRNRLHRLSMRTLIPKTRMQ
jgi:type II secretory pathway pseudopilin PulG